MPWILVAESEGRFAERIRDGLAADGWRVEIVASAAAAEALASERPPDLLLASAELDGAAALLERHSRRRGGSGAVALLPEIGGDMAIAEVADESISKPFTDQDLRLLVRRFAVTGHAPRKPAPAGAGEPRLTSQDLFGDVLAEMGEQVKPAKSAARVPAEPPPAPQPAPSAAAASEVDRVLEKTLSGLLDNEKKPARPSARLTDARVDELISRTLSSLGAPERPRKQAPPPKPAAASDTPALDRLFESARPPSGESRRPSREFDFSELDELARPAARTKGGTPRADGPELEKLPEVPTGEPKAEPFGTQRVSIPAALRGRPVATEFGQYALLERIAVGGMAEVWKARRKGVEGFQKTVAIKKILAHLTDSSDFVTMFIDEAKLAAQLNHTNIIHIYDLGKIGDDYYIAMEYVDGRDMRTILNTAREKAQPLPMGIALLVASRLASALDHAHRMKDFEGRPLEIVHRDVSPQNVLISFEGEVKLCDFGIVKAVTKASKTQIGALKGKLQYMSPEQAWGRPVDSRSDIFSLGSLLFEMLTGRRLFAGDSEMSVLDAVREGRIQAPHDIDPRLPLEVNALVLKALAKDPADRFETAGEMQKQIDAILASLRPAPSQHELAETMKRLFGASRAVPAALEAALEPPPALGPIVLEPIAAEPKAAKLPAATKTADVARVAAETLRPTTRAGDEALETTAGRGRGLLWIGIAAALVLGLVGYFLLGRDGGTPEVAPPGPSAPAETLLPPAEGVAEPEAPTAAPDAGAAGPEETAGATPPADVVRIVDSEVKKREEELRRQYEAELERKQRELAEAQPEPADTPKVEAQAPASSAGSPKPAPEQPATEAPQPTAVPPATEPAPTQSAPVAEPRPAPATRPPSAATPARPAAAPPPPPPTPTVKEGDLVQPGAGVRPPVLVSIDRPEYPPVARRLRVEGTVLMSLLVDEKGQVLDVRLESGIRQNVGINEVALEAARSAKFRPATKDGVRVKMWYQLKVPFKL